MIITVDYIMDLMIVQGQHPPAGWSAPPDPTILAAYNAALESLRSRPMPGAASTSAQATGTAGV